MARSDDDRSTPRVHLAIPNMDDEEGIPLRTFAALPKDTEERNPFSSSPVINSSTMANDINIATRFFPPMSASNYQALQRIPKQRPSAPSIRRKPLPPNSPFSPPSSPRTSLVLPPPLYIATTPPLIPPKSPFRNPLHDRPATPQIILFPDESLHTVSLTTPSDPGEEKLGLTKAIAGDRMSYVNYEAAAEGSEASFPIRRGRCERLRGCTGRKACVVVGAMIVLFVVMVSVVVGVGVNRFLSDN